MIRDLWSRISDQGSAMKAPRSRIRIQGSAIKDRRSRIRDQGSAGKDPQSWMRDRRRSRIALGVEFSSTTSPWCCKRTLYVPIALEAAAATLSHWIFLVEVPSDPKMKRFTGTFAYVYNLHMSTLPKSSGSKKTATMFCCRGLAGIILQIRPPS